MLRKMLLKPQLKTHLQQIIFIAFLAFSDSSKTFIFFLEILGRNQLSLQPFELQWSALQFWKLELKQK